MNAHNPPQSFGNSFKLSQTVRFGRVKFNSDTFYLHAISVLDEQILKRSESLTLN